MYLPLLLLLQRRQKAQSTSASEPPAFCAARRNMTLSLLERDFGSTHIVANCSLTEHVRSQFAGIARREYDQQFAIDAEAALELGH